MESLWEKEIEAGAWRQMDVSVPRIYGYGELAIRALTCRGGEDGPRLLITAGIHGDEINGAEIVRLLLEELDGKLLRGQIMLMPMVNVYGLVGCSRYLPDRKDLNRAFPGDEEGSLAARMAHLLMKQAVEGASHLIDLHSASLNRSNLPQLRACLDDEEVRECALAFAAPAILDGDEVSGSLRCAAREAGVKALLYEAGASGRFNREAIAAGVEGILRTMRHLRMVADAPEAPEKESVILSGGNWERAPEGGFFHPEVQPGDRVEKGQNLGFVCDCAGENRHTLRASSPGIIIGATVDPRVNLGDAVVHIGKIASRETGAEGRG